jgi:hypothetical protein
MVPFFVPVVLVGCRPNDRTGGRSGIRLIVPNSFSAVRPAAAAARGRTRSASGSTDFFSFSNYSHKTKQKTLDAFVTRSKQK